MVQQIKDLVLSLLWFGLLLWCRFSPRPGKFLMLQEQPKIIFFNLSDLRVSTDATILNNTVCDH